jgi:polar amino acid transport system substrate-binding protein
MEVGQPRAGLVLLAAGPPEMVACLKSGACDVGFLEYDPARAAAVEGLSPAFIEFDYTYLVPKGSAIRTVADADRPGILDTPDK